MSKTARVLTWCSSAVVVLAVAAFRERWVLTAWSAVPLFLALLSVFLVCHFRSEAEQLERTAYGSDLTEREQCVLWRYMSFAFAVLTPWQGIFVFFFEWGKLCTIVLFLVSFLTAPILFRLRFGKQIRARRERERIELEEQRKKEEQGKWS